MKQAAQQAEQKATAELLCEVGENGVVRLILNRPQAYNSLSTALMRQLLKELARLAADQSVKVIVIAGAGRGFCAGHDLDELRGASSAKVRQQIFVTCAELMLAVTRQPQPVIAQVHGVATAAGCQLVATCDLAVASETARFATPGVNIGLFCSTPMVAVSRALHRKHALQMLLTGEMVDAQEAMRIGLINNHCPQDELERRTGELAATIAAKSRRVVGIGKEAFQRQLEMDLPGAYDWCAQVMSENLGLPQAQEGIAAFQEKRPPVWPD